MLGGARSQLERRAIKKRSAQAQFNGSDEVNDALAGISAFDRENILSFMNSGEFENLCFEIAVAGCMPGSPEAHLDELKNTLELSLRRYVGVEDRNMKLVCQALFSEVAAISWREVNRHQMESGVSKRSFTPEIISAHIASVARNAQLHRKIADLSEIDQFAKRLSQQCARVHGRIRPAQTESGARVPFAQLYVPTNLAVNNKGSDAEEFSDVRVLLRQVSRLVVLGDPGGGKTTLALKLTLDVARGMGTGSAPQTPLRVVLRDYAVHYRFNQQSIIEYLEKQCKADYSTPAPKGAIEYLLLNGRGVVIFDGLDELTDTSLRTAIVDAVEAFTHSYPSASILVTSRRVGYEMAPLDENLFTTASLSPFNSVQQNEYVKKWFAHVKASADDGHTARRFLAEAAHAKDLTSNPLMLGLMCALYRGEGYIPRNRPDLYRRCSEFLFERWDASRGITVAQPFERGIQFAMFSLALSMLRNSGETGGMTERELIRYTSDYLLDQQFEDRDSSDAAADAFVKYCRGRAWVLTDVGTNPDGERIYSFTHRTFLEYFSARQLVRESGDAESLYRDLRTHLVNESWDVTSQLAIQFLDERLDDAANKFVGLALEDAEQISAVWEKVALVSFCARLLEFITLRPAVVRATVSALYHITVMVQSSERDLRRQPSGALSAAWSGLVLCAPETRTVANDELLKSINSAASQYDEVRYALSLAEFVPNYSDASVRRFWAEQERKNALDVPLLNLAQEDARAAAVAVLFGLLSASDAVGWHGPSVMTVQDLLPPVARRDAHTVLSELTYPRFRWAYDQAEVIAGDVVGTLLQVTTPWMHGRQNFIRYSMSLPDGKDSAACGILDWMLGREMEEDMREGADEGEEDDFSDIGSHDLYQRVARARVAKVYDSRIDRYRDKLRPEFFTFLVGWCRGEFSLSTPDGD